MEVDKRAEQVCFCGGSMLCPLVRPDYMEKSLVEDKREKFKEMSLREKFYVEARESIRNKDEYKISLEEEE